MLALWATQDKAKAVRQTIDESKQNSIDVADTLAQGTVLFPSMVVSAPWRVSICLGRGNPMA
jgi:hypothetical protein